MSFILVVLKTKSTHSGDDQEPVFGDELPFGPAVASELGELWWRGRFGGELVAELRLLGRLFSEIAKKREILSDILSSVRI